MSDTYLKAILVSAVGGLYMIAYSLYYIGTQVYSGGSISIVQQTNPKYQGVTMQLNIKAFSLTC